VRSLVALAALVSALLVTSRADACCPAPPSGKPVVNADQTVILIWDAPSKTEHFIRRASFKSEADDFGFLVPTPQKPELDESGDGAFPLLAKVTAPEVIKRSAPSGGCNGCGLMRSKSAAVPAAAEAKSVEVLEEKTVAGFHASVLEATSASALVAWLKEHGYAFSPEVEAWAKPYVDGGWKITALRVAKEDASKADKRVAAASLRLSFKTERPLFPYREPDPTQAASAVGASSRLLRIYFVGDARYDGETAKDLPWTGTVAWSGKVAPVDRQNALAALRLAPASTPDEWWLTEFEDPWPYRKNPADLYFSKSQKQETVKRPPIVEYTTARDVLENENAKAKGDAAWAALGLAVLFVLRLRRASGARAC
jgi:hypothetical protein